MLQKMFAAFKRRLLADVPTKSDIAGLYQQLAGLHAIHSALHQQSFAFPMRGWAISPDAMHHVLCALTQFQSPTVIEFGSGQSTVILASLCKQLNGRLTSVEHDVEYSRSIQRQLSAFNLANVVETQIVALSDQGVLGRTYDLTALSVPAIDIALVDGPPGHLAPHTRLGPLEWAVHRLSRGGVAFLDDSARPAEQEVLALLQTRQQGLCVTLLDTEKGLAKITREDAAEQTDKSNANIAMNRHMVS